MIPLTGIHRWSAAPRLLLALACLSALACSETDPIGPEPDPAEQVDRTPPPPVQDLTASYPAAGGSALLTWTAPRDEGGASEDVSRYEIRYSYSFPLVWKDAPAVPAPPEPAPAGELQQYEFSDPQRGRDLFSAIRSYDASGNPSAIGNVSHVYITGLTLDGRCVDVFSGGAVEGLGIQVIDRRVHQTGSDPLGRYRVDDLSPGTVHLSARSGASETNYHTYRRTLELSGDASLEQIMIPYAPAELPAVDNVFTLLLRAVGYNRYRQNLVKWRVYPIDVYVPAFTNTDGVDYGDLCRRAVEHWNDRVGEALFRLVDTQPDTGVWFQFEPRSEIAPHIGVTHHENDAAGYPKTSDISIVDDFADPDPLWRVALHELGHTLRFGHLPAGYLMYGGQPLPDTVTNDEVAMTLLYLALPNRANLSVYDDSAPE